jgi:hypothetical protein
VNWYKHRLFLPMLILLFTWTGCGVQAYIAHQNHITQQKIRESLQRVNEATTYLEEVDKRVKEETKHLQELLKMLPPKPVPDHTSKL